MTADTIAARATPDGRGALAILRLSGPQAIDIAERVFRPTGRLGGLKTQTCIIGHIEDSGGPIDQVVVTLFRSPHSFTGEDMVEITCHGGSFIAGRVLDVLFAVGARPARPGEFSERAFVNGRLDLSQAEAIGALIEAKSTIAARAALRVLNGGLREPLAAQLERLVEALAHLESRIDIELHAPDVLGSIPPDRVPATRGAKETDDPVPAILGDAARCLSALQSRGRASPLVSNSIRVVFAGRTNAGKSSIFNGYLCEERAIVSAEPRTTRDVLASTLEWDGLPVELVDTAGFAVPHSEVECEAERRTQQALNGATVVVLVVDVRSMDPSEVSADIGRLPRDSRVIVALHKWDLPERGKWIAFSGFRHTRSSVTHEPGLGPLREEVLSAIREEVGDVNECMLVCDRQRRLIARAHLAIARASDLLEQRAGDELIADEVRTAAGAVGEILGRKIGPLVLEEIFSRFCVGK